jgi:hypothetical protein
MSENMIVEKINLSNQDLGLKKQEVARRQSHLLDLKFKQVWIDSLKERVPTLYDPNVVDDHISGLRGLGFSNPRKIIESFDRVLSHTLENVGDKITGLKERGFSDPQKMIEASPTILGHSLGNIDSKIAGLKDRGFSSPQKMIESFPTILSYDLDNIDIKLAGLKKRGFVNPSKMIESLPPILGLSLKNIDDKITGLKERGFSDPKRMIEALPRALSYAFKNIDRRLRLVGEITRLYKVPFTAVQLMEAQNSLFTSKIDKIVTLTRILKKFTTGPEEITNAVINRLFFSSLEDVLIATDIAGEKQNLTLDKLAKLVKEVKAAGFTKEEKQIAIEQGLRNDQKIKLRYLRGYSEKKEPVSAVVDNKETE